jgi:drug/metabolite transporter (DMT)-like permease
VLALISALAFGVTTPLVQRFGHAVGSFATASLLYAGAALVGLVSRSKDEARLKRVHFPRIVAVAVLGAGLAPAALAWGLARTSGTAASLMLNLEAVFTLVLARLFYGEHVGRRVAFAAALLVVGGALLVFDRGRADGGASHVVGLVAIAAASLAWAMDNTVAKPLSELDPAAVVAAKGALGATLSACVALALGERWPAPLPLLGLVVVGGTGYGLSLRLYLKAQRALGAGRTASVFASAPFCGALLAWALVRSWSSGSCCTSRSSTSTGTSTRRWSTSTRTATTTRITITCTIRCRKGSTRTCTGIAAWCTTIRTCRTCTTATRMTTASTSTT